MSEAPSPPSLERVRNLVLPWLPAAVYMVLIWTLSSLSSTPVPVSSMPFQDKGAHFLEYALLAFLVSYALRGTFPRVRPSRRFLLAVTATVLWGMLDEIHQAYVPGRSSDIHDVLADALGALVGALAFALLKRPAAER